MQQRPYVSREVMRERISLAPSACQFIRMRHMRIRDWGRVRDMIIPVAATPPGDEVQKTVALLEQGTEALAFSTGMAAITAMMEIFSPGDHLIATDDLYGGTLETVEYDQS